MHPSKKNRPFAVPRQMNYENSKNQTRDQVQSRDQKQQATVTKALMAD